MFEELYCAVNGTSERIVSIGDASINTLADDQIQQHPIAGRRVVMWVMMEDEVRAMEDTDDG